MRTHHSRTSPSHSLFKIDANAQQTYANDEEIEGYFYKLWSDLDRDTLSPLLSRVANSIAVVRREDEQVMEEHCK